MLLATCYVKKSIVSKITWRCELKKILTVVTAAILSTCSATNIFANNKHLVTLEPDGVHAGPSYHNLTIGTISGGKTEINNMIIKMYNNADCDDTGGASQQGGFLTPAGSGWPMSNGSKFHITETAAKQFAKDGGGGPFLSMDIVFLQFGDGNTVGNLQSMPTSGTSGATCTNFQSPAGCTTATCDLPTSVGTQTIDPT